MDWIIALALFGLFVWIGKRTREKMAERAASGQLQSPLYQTANGLVLVLLGLTFYIMYVHHNHGEIPSFLWTVVALIVVALLLLRRALKRRYPYV
jgi:L-asparagine transporter-like permease